MAKRNNGTEPNAWWIIIVMMVIFAAFLYFWVVVPTMNANDDSMFCDRLGLEITDANLYNTAAYERTFNGINFVKCCGFHRQDNINIRWDYSCDWYASELI